MACFDKIRINTICISTVPVQDASTTRALVTGESESRSEKCTSPLGSCSHLYKHHLLFLILFLFLSSPLHPNPA